MGLEYDVEHLPEKSVSERIRELQVTLAPRNQCGHYALTKARGRATLMTKKEFDDHVGKFSHGPFKDSFGDNDGDPYNPNRQVFGTLDSGSVAYCELSNANRELTKELLGLVEQES